MTEPVTFLDALADALLRAASYNRRDQIAPAAVLWPDQEREWEMLIPRLRERLPILAYGHYHPEERSGPAVWMRCMVARTLPEQQLPEEAIPIIYFPDISGRILRSHLHRPKELEVLTELQYRSVFWIQRDGRDWTLASFMQNKEEGLGIAIRDDTRTLKSMQQALIALAEQPLSKMRDEAPWRASDFDALLGFSSDAEPGITNLIARGESAKLEFKATARWDVRQNKKNTVMEDLIVKTVAAFLNSHYGGTLLIGVEDDGTVHGLADDYQLWKPEERNRDKYELWLMNLLLTSYGKEFGPYIRATFHNLEGKEICKVSVAPAPKPAFTKEGIEERLYIKTGNSTRWLTVREAIEYVKNRWN
jgi:hypothetical protein